MISRRKSSRNLENLHVVCASSSASDVFSPVSLLVKNRKLLPALFFNALPVDKLLASIYALVRVVCGSHLQRLEAPSFFPLNQLVELPPLSAGKPCIPYLEFQGAMSYRISNGPDPAAVDVAPWVTLISNDNFEFNIRRSAANVSGTIRRMLDPQSPYILTIART